MRASNRPETEEVVVSDEVLGAIVGLAGSRAHGRKRILEDVSGAKR